MRRAPRVLFIALDAMDRDLVMQWAQAGRLPVFASLFERGASGRTRNPPGLLVGAVWPSFFTGTSPARHGRYCYEQIIDGTCSVRRFMTTDLGCSPFWTHLSAAGRRVAVVDVPKSPLTPHLNGIQVVDWATHDPESDSSFRTWPMSLAADITARHGRDHVAYCNRIDRSAAGIEAFCRNLESSIAAKTAMCREMLACDSWDLFLAVFAESHCVGHQCWALHDTSFATHDPALAAAVGDPLERIYVALDAAVGVLLREAGSDTTVIVLTSHGMGPHYDATFMLDDILERIDPQPGAQLRRAFRWSGRYWQALLRRIWFGAPLHIPLGVGRRRYFAVPNNEVYGGIRINLAGREPRGTVRSDELEEVCAELRRKLLELINADTGEPLVRDVWRFADLYRGPRAKHLPDFCVEWNCTAPIKRVSSPTIGTLDKRFRGVRNGDHKPEGFFWATGPQIEAGRSLPPVAVTDFAATVGELLDVRLPDIDGRPIEALLSGATGVCH